jgi:hypothetical protein
MGRDYDSKHNTWRHKPRSCDEHKDNHHAMKAHGDYMSHIVKISINVKDVKLSLCLIKYYSTKTYPLPN